MKQKASSLERKKERKLSLFAGNMLIYIENPIEATHNKAVITNK